jgi:cell division protein ZapA (FtsZ GTPase activity inhibitor)/lambda repressor-like predicted transcriptional regulator
MSIAPGPVPVVSLSATTPRAPTSEDDSEKLQGDRKFVLAAVQKDGAALRFASEELKGDREIVLAAVHKHGAALRFASEELKGDREIVLAAVQNDGYALECASEKLKADRGIVLAAVNLGCLRPTVASELDALGDKIAEIAKYFPELEQQAQEASARIENPCNDNGKYSRVHQSSRKQFETDFNCK